METETAEAQNSTKAPANQVAEQKTEAKTQATESEPKTTEAKAPVELKETAKDPGVSEQQPVVPEKYDLKLPKNSSLSQAHVDLIEKEAKDKGLSQDQAQALLDRDNGLKSSFFEEQQAQMKQAADNWFEAAKNDKEIGGDNFKQNVELAKRALDRFASDDMKKVLNDTGLGNNPELIRTFMKVAKHLGDDKLVTASHRAQRTGSFADRLYPTTKQKD